MFNYNQRDGLKSLDKITMSDLFSDVKLTTNRNKLKDKGYIYLDTAHRELKLEYMAKPTEAVCNYMATSGRGEPGKAHIRPDNAISFVCYWDSPTQILETTPVVAGVVEQEDLDNFKNSAKYEGECLVTQAFKNFHYEHNLYHLRNANEPTGRQLEKVQNLARLVWVAVGYALDNQEIIKRAEKGEFNNFYLKQDRLDYLHKKFGITVPVLDKEKRIQDTEEFSIK